MIKVNDFRPGITFLHDNEILVVIESAHSKSGRGQAHVKAKVKNLKTGTIKTITFTGGDLVTPALIEKKAAQYLYHDDHNFLFMDCDTYDQIAISSDVLEWEKNFLIEGDNVKLRTYQSIILGVELKSALTMTVVYTEPAVKGNTISGSTKPARLATGFVLQVPLFIDNGDNIIVNTNDGSYKSRA